MTTLNIWFIFLSMEKNWELKHVIVYRCLVLFIQSISWRQLKLSLTSKWHLPDFTQRNWELWSPLTVLLALPFSFPKWKTAARRGEKTWAFSNAFMTSYSPPLLLHFSLGYSSELRTHVTGVRHEAARVSFHCYRVLACSFSSCMALPGCTHCPAAACLPPIHPPPVTFC